MAAANKADDDGQIIPELASYRDGLLRGLGFAIDKELMTCGVALEINGDEYR